MDSEERETTDAATEPEKDTTTPGPESVPSEGDLDEDLPGVPDEDGE